MERFDYMPPLTVHPRNVPGLSIREIPLEAIEAVREMNRIIFREERIINTFERDEVMILEASIDGEPVAFKIDTEKAVTRFTARKEA